MTASAEKSAVVFTPSGALYTVPNGNVIEYKKVNGVFYHVDTADAVVRALEQARSCRQRIRIYYGETDPSKADVGRDWLEEHDVEGYIGNSLGPLKVPLLVHNRRSHGGGALLDQCIIKIKWTSGGIIYRHPRYNHGQFTIREIGPEDAFHGGGLREQGYTHAVDVDGKNHANFKSVAAARRYLHKMVG